MIYLINLLKKRFVAYVIAFFVVSAFMWIISAILYVVANPYAIFPVYGYFPFIVPVLCIVYFTCCEKLKGATVMGRLTLVLQKQRIETKRDMLLVINMLVVLSASILVQQVELREAISLAEKVSMPIML